MGGGVGVIGEESAAGGFTAAVCFDAIPGGESILG